MNTKYDLTMMTNKKLQLEMQLLFYEIFYDFDPYEAKDVGDQEYEKLSKALDMPPDRTAFVSLATVTDNMIDDLESELNFDAANVHYKEFLKKASYLRLLLYEWDRRFETTKDERQGEYQMARKSIARGIISIVSKDHEVLLDLIDYIDKTKEYSDYYIELKCSENSDDITKTNNGYSLCCPFSGIGRWQFNVTLKDLGMDMQKRLDEVSIKNLEGSDFKMNFKFTDYEKLGNVLYKSEITLNHKKDTRLSDIEYHEDMLHYLKINELTTRCLDIFDDYDRADMSNESDIDDLDISELIR